MSKKNYDNHNRWRNKTVAFRVSAEEDLHLEALVKLTGLTKQDYIIRRLLERDVVVQGNPRVYKALRDQLAAVLDELRRIEAGQGVNGELLDTIPDTVDHAGDYAMRTASRREIQEFSEKLAQFGLTFSDVADNCPRQERTFAACRRVLDFARTQPELLKRVEDTGKLPMGELSAGSGTDRKTMERHRKYLVAILLAFTNGYEIIRGHLCQIAPSKGGSMT